MSLINKIKNSIEENTKLTCLYDDLGNINRRLDYQSYPLCFFTLINRGGLISVNGVYRELANVVIFFVNTSTFDFESLENEQIIESCKSIALKWLDSLPRNGVLKATVLDTSRVYNYSDSILTGYCLNLRIEELEGEGCLNPLIPDSRKCEVIVSTEEGGTVEGSGTYIINSPCTISATPDSEHRFSGWYIGEDLISTEPTYTFTITESGTLNINGVFEAKSLVINSNDPTSMTLVNSNGDEYILLIERGENKYYGDVEGFELTNITKLKKRTGYYNSVLTIDASVLTSWTTIDSYEFNNLEWLTELILPDTFTTLGDYALGGCTRLRHITFPASLSSIGYKVFSGDTDMESITFLSTIPPTFLGAGVDPLGDTSCPIYVPADLVNDYKTAWTIYASRIQAITE